MEWPDNRYRRRLALRLRRRHYHNRPAPGCPAPACGEVEAVPSESPAAAPDPANDAAQKAKDQLLRLQAEFENFRRRTRKEMEEVRAQAASGLMEAVLPVLDNFGRALKMPATSLDGFLEGVRMIHSHFGNILREAGLETIEAKGLPFDPKIHEAVAVEASEEVPDNTVLEVLQDGYMLRGKLLRPAMVKVSRQA